MYLWKTYSLILLTKLFLCADMTYTSELITERRYLVGSRVHFGMRSWRSKCACPRCANVPRVEEIETSWSCRGRVFHRFVVLRRSAEHRTPGVIRKLDRRLPRRRALCRSPLLLRHTAPPTHYYYTFMTNRISLPEPPEHTISVNV